jgi:hypothetical protein
MKEGLEQVILNARADAVTELYMCCGGITLKVLNAPEYVSVSEFARYKCFIKHCAMKAFMGVGVLFHEFLNSALDRGEWSAS